MIIVYDSLTGMGKRFAAKLPFESIDINDVGILQDDCILITRSFGFGRVPDTTLKFLDANAARVKGVAVSGNKNWGSAYGGAAKIIHEEFNLPIIHVFEASGFDSDVKIVQKYINEELDETNTKMATT